MNKQPTPDFRITLEGKDLTSSIEPRLQSLSITECRQDEADSLDITLDDHDGRLAIPKRGALLEVSIGWLGSPLTNKGKFTVNEVEHAGAPDTITIRARSASMTKGMGERQEKSWHGKTIAAIVGAIAAKHSLKPAVNATLGKTVIPHIDQTNESDMSFLTRLAKRYDAVMTVKDGCLLFMPIGEARTASGQQLQVLAIARGDGDQHRYHIAERENFAGVKARYHSNAKGQTKDEIVGGESEKNLKVLPEIYPTQAEAKAAATAEYKRVQRSQATMDYTLSLGRAEIFPELPVTVSGFKPEIDETPWLVKRVRHSIGEGGFTSALELEVRDDPTTDRHRSHFRKGG
jgi:phage protein D